MALLRKPRSMTIPVLLAVAGAVCVCGYRLGLNEGDFDNALANASELILRFFPPEYNAAPKYGPLLFESVAMALWGTAIAFALSFISTFGAARNFAPNAVVYHAFRYVLNLCRVVPELILAIVFVSAFGPGPLAGVLTVSVGCWGQLGKMWTEALERVPAATVECAAASGAHGFQLLRFCGWPSVSREVWGFVLYCFDRAIRESVIIGVVGAGGIGMELSLDLRMFDYSRAAIVIFMIAALLVTSEGLSSLVRKRLA